MGEVERSWKELLADASPDGVLAELCALLAMLTAGLTLPTEEELVGGCIFLFRASL
jgi:hypothetical protein